MHAITDSLSAGRQTLSLKDSSIAIARPLSHVAASALTAAVIAWIAFVLYAQAFVAGFMYLLPRVAQALPNRMLAERGLCLLA